MDIQKVNFEGFSEPILIPQFKNLFLVKFEGTGKVKKDSEAEKIEFTDNEGKTYIFNSEDVQKTGNSDFYINLHTLRRYYDIKFEDDFQRYVPDLNYKDTERILNKTFNLYDFNNKFKTEFQNTVKDILYKTFSDNVGEYTSTPCERNMTGILNIYPKKDSLDDNNNQWSLLNNLPNNKVTLKLLLKKYIEEFKSFEHNEFISWIKDNPSVLTNDFIDVIVRELELESPLSTVQGKLLKRIFKTNDLFFVKCPNEKNKKDLLVVYYEGKPMKIQYIRTSGPIHHQDGEYKLTIGKKQRDKYINYDADFILFTNGSLFLNDNAKPSTLIRHGRVKPAVSFPNPPIIGSELVVD